MTDDVEVTLESGEGILTEKAVEYLRELTRARPSDEARALIALRHYADRRLSVVKGELDTAVQHAGEAGGLLAEGGYLTPAMRRVTNDTDQPEPVTGPGESAFPLRVTLDGGQLFRYAMAQGRNYHDLNPPGGTAGDGGEG